MRQSCKRRTPRTARGRPHPPRPLNIHPPRRRPQGLCAETRTYNVVMAACNAAGKFVQTLAVYQAMTGAGRAPSTASFNAAIAAHCK